MSANDLLKDVLEKPSGKKPDGMKTVGKKNDEPGQEKSFKPNIDGIKDKNAKGAVSSKSSEKIKKNDGQEKVPDLSAILLEGFKTLKESMETMGVNIAQQVSEEIMNTFDYGDEEDIEYHEEYHTANNEPHVQGNVLEDITKDFQVEETKGPDVPDVLAKLVNSLLGTKTNECSISSRELKYLQPNNVPFVEAPKVNKIVWDAMPGPSRSVDTLMQGIQKDFLLSAIPTVKVIEKLFEARESPQDLDVNELITTLSDSIAFLGTANLKTIRNRREVIRRDIPDKLKGLCNPDVEFTGSLLFGENLMGKIKEVTEASKIASDLKKSESVGFIQRGRTRGRFKSGRYPVRGRGNRGSVARIGNGTRGNRFSPYNRRLNGRRPWTRRA